VPDSETAGAVFAVGLREPGADASDSARLASACCRSTFRVPSISSVDRRDGLKGVLVADHTLGQAAPLLAPDRGDEELVSRLARQS
jgi:hypothetical protein